MKPEHRRVIEQLVVDKDLAEAVKRFSKTAVVRSLEAAVALARSNHLKCRADRLALSDKKRPSDSEKNLKRKVDEAAASLAEICNRPDWDAQEEFNAHVAKKWTGGIFSGLLFDRGRSTLATHLEEVEKIEAALVNHKAVPIMVDDSGEGSYDGWAFGVFRSIDDWIAQFGDHWLTAPRSLEPWQWLAGVVAWTRPGPKLEGNPFAQACEPGWHWIKSDPERTIDGALWSAKTALVKKGS